MPYHDVSFWFASPEVDAFLHLDAQKLDVIPVNLDGSTPPQLIESALMARNTIFAERYTTQELCDRIADAFQRPAAIASGIRKWIVAAAAVVLLAVIGIVLWRVLARKGAKETGAEATPAPTEAPEEPQIDPNIGIPREDLNKIYELVILGGELRYETPDQGYINRFGYARLGAEHFANRADDENGVRWYSNDDGHEIEPAHWDDLGFLRYLTNLKMLTIVCVDGTLPDLSGLSNLELVELYDSSITDIEGLRGSRITHFGYIGEALDFSPLSDCMRLNSATVDLKGDVPRDLDTFGPPTLHILNLSAGSENGVASASGLSACTALTEVGLNDLALTDLNCLSNAKDLLTLNLNSLRSLRSLNGLEGCEQLNYLHIDNCEALDDLSALSACKWLRMLDAEDFNAADLSFLANAASLKELYLRNIDSITSLHGLEDHGALEKIDCSNLRKLTDISALQNCMALNLVRFSECFRLSDLSPIVKQPKLKSLELYGAGPDDVSFLADIVNKDYFSFGISEVSDWSGLAEINSYAFLNVTDRSGSALPYIAGKTVWRFELWNRRGYDQWRTAPLDYTQFPNVTTELILHGATSLEGLPALPAYKVYIDESQYLTSLNGLENLPNFAGRDNGELCIDGCPRLTDWSALDGMQLSTIELKNTFSLPAFKNFQAKNIRLENTVDLKDLSAFDSYEPACFCSIELFETNDVQDLSPLYGIKTGDMLRVPAHLGEQARALVDSGNFKNFDIVYPEGWWRPAEIHVSLLSLDELETLPSAVLTHVDRLCMAGDRIYDPDEYRIDEDWDGNQLTMYLVRHDSDEREPIGYGTQLTDLSVLQNLTGLKELQIYCQPLETLDGIQYLESLEVLELKGSKTVTDASAVFTQQSLRGLDLHGTSVTSIEGVQNLYNLEWLNLDGLQIDDLSPLGGCSEHLDVNVKLPLMIFEDFCNLPAGVRNRFNEVSFSGQYVHDPYDRWWTEEDWDHDHPVLCLRNRQTDELIPLGPGVVTDLSVLPEMTGLHKLHLFGQPLTTLAGIETFRSLEGINVRQCPNVTDLSPLFDMASLHEIRVDSCGVTSIGGIQKLKELQNADISHCPVTDLSPIGALDFAYCMQPNDDGWTPYFSLRIDGLSEYLPKEQYAVLSAVPRYDQLNVWNTDVSLWLDAVRGKQIRCLQAGGCNIKNDDLRRIAEEHPELEELNIPWNPHQLTDLTPLLSMPNLRYVRISRDLSAAIRSLGDDPGFRLDIEG